MPAQKGFTLIELVVAVGILAVLAFAALFSFHPFKKQAVLDSAAEELLGSLRMARSKTLSSEGNASYGIHFETSGFTLFKGAAYSSGSPDNKAYPIDPSLSISDISLAGGVSDLVFARLTGTVGACGYVKISQANDASKYKIIYIGPGGTISLSDSEPLDSDRVKDSRHIHVLYFQNTRNAAILALVFPGLTENINYQDHLNGDRTEFDWSGAVMVGGEEQELSVHTHVLSSESTLFCIHRDRRYNSKALQIFIDGQNIISYSETGATTPGDSAWAGQPEAQ